MSRRSRPAKAAHASASAQRTPELGRADVPRWLAIAIVGACLLSTLSFWWVWRFGYTCDHVISGLMAKSILHRGERPLFLWMLGYNGILIETYAVATFFWLFGETPRIYYLFSTFCFLGLAALLYQHVRARYDALSAALSSLFFVISAPRVYYYVMRPQPNYGEIFFIGVLLMHLASRLVDALWREQRGADAQVVGLSAACGFLVGFGLYTYQLIFFFIGATGLWLLAPYLEDLASRRERLKPALLPMWRGMIAIAIVGLVALVCAASTFLLFGRSGDAQELAKTLFRFGAMAIVAGCAGEYGLSRFDTLRAHAKTVAAFFGAALLGFAPSLFFTYVLHGFSRDRLRVSLSPDKVWVSLQFFVQAQRRFLNAWDGPWAPVVGLVILATAIALLWSTMAVLHGIARGRQGKEALQTTSPLALMPLVTAPLFCFAAAAEDWESARWTIGLSLFFALAQARALRWAIGRGRWLRPVAISLALGVLAHNAQALNQALHSPEAHAFYGEELVDALRHKGITRGYGTYWYCYSIAFITNEEIVIEPVFNNYSPHYAPMVAGAPKIAFVDDVSPRLQQFPAEVQIGPHRYRKTDSWYGKRAGFVVLERLG